MRTFSKIFLKVSKFFFFIFGTIAAIVCLALGVVGTYKSAEAKSFVNTTIQSSSSTLTDIETKLVEFEDMLTNPDSSVNDVINKVKSFVETTKTTLDNQRSQLNEMANKLNELAQKESNSSVKQSLTEAVSQINNLIKLIGSPDDNTTDSVYGIINEIIKITEQNGSLDEMKDKLLSLFEQANSYINPINDYLTSWDENRVNQTYDTTTTVLLAVGATLLGLAVFGAVLSLILYKRADGKLVNRFRSKKEVIEHVDKILKKYPDVKKYLGKGA
ncbi:MAG: MG_279/MG_280 family protein [Malacoplasma sp.]|nr:MG_279/MG_280 family protein [Malacoplasma sp.]MDE6646094.1 MG_279/MG_280 family protein [Malacoplasma sp.]MDE6894030.1 MG_279/MG_280 family protein [Malacoplasma sp.]MDE7075021.1 MG_279/MG_280 family protein [Malacoplasma sp.]MDE7087904.1 MG_279/MG_280 family protein [Malacoplasma sp.]